MPIKKPSIDIIIPSYNAQKLLHKNLPKVIQNSPEVDKIIIVDDGSTDTTGIFLKKYKKQKIRYIKKLKNTGFTSSVNLGVQHSTAEFIVLLNNDVVPTANYIKNSLYNFDDPRVFAVNFNETNSSWPHVTWDSGKIHFTQGRDKTLPRYTAWCSGGSSIIRRSVWKKLSGFNEIYSPGYWEDIDLGFRSWLNGYKIIWEPSSIVEHKHESSFKKLNQTYINSIKQRNELLFIWQNFIYSKYFFSHILFLLRHTLLHPGYLKIIIMALQKLPSLSLPKSRKQSLSMVLEKINKKANS